jgi:putative FmdB family regulatory protein
MPLYDFDCRACGARFEAQAAPGASAPCTVCGSDDVQRVWSTIPPPPKTGLRGRAARESDKRRAEREARRREGG